MTRAGPREAALSIVHRLVDAGHVAYLAGGCVRDEMLGFEPKDYDVATDARPERLKQLWPSARAVGEAFGVMLVRAHGITVEVATFRADGAYEDYRRPSSIEFADPEADARRRDFTINGLFEDPIGGRVIDFVGGRADLDAKVIRAIGDPAARLAEDHLRSLRAVRFAARYGFAIEPRTREAVRRDAAALAGVSRERIGQELRIMLAHPSRARAVALLAELGLDAAIFGDFDDAVPGVGAGPRLAGLPDVAPEAAPLAAWLLDARPDLAACDEGPPCRELIAEAAAGWRAALVLSNREHRALEDVVGLVGLVEGRWRALGVATRRRRASEAAFEAALALVRTGDEPLAEAVAADVAALSDLPGGLRPVPLIGGADLIAAGLAPGPAFTGLLDAVYDAQLESRVDTPEAAVALALELARNGAGEASGTP